LSKATEEINAITIRIAHGERLPSLGQTLGPEQPLSLPSALTAAAHG